MSDSTAAPDATEFRRAMSLVPTAVTIVATAREGRPAGATANAVVALSLDPLLMLASLHRNSRTLGAIAEHGRFSINVLASDQEAMARRFASQIAIDAKWEGVTWEERDGAPWLDGALVTLSCELRERHEGGDHEILIGEVLSIESHGGAPLLFHRGAYPTVGLD